MESSMKRTRSAPWCPPLSTILPLTIRAISAGGSGAEGGNCQGPSPSESDFPR